MFDYHDGEWPARVRDWAGGGGVAAAINAAPSGEAAALSTVADGGRLATITGAPPAAARGVTIVDIYVQADAGVVATAAGHVVLDGPYLPAALGDRLGSAPLERVDLACGLRARLRDDEADAALHCELA